MSTYNREQVKGIMMVALGPLMPHEVAKAHADLVFGIVDRNPEVQLLLNKLADKPSETPVLARIAQVIRDMEAAYPAPNPYKAWIDELYKVQADIVLERQP